jgi:transposase
MSKNNTLSADSGSNTSPIIKSRVAERDEQIINLFKKSYSPKEIAGTIGISQTTIIARLKKLGLKAEKIKISDKKLTKLFHDGLSVPEISKKLNCHRLRVFRRLQQLGLLVKKVRTINLTVKEIRQLEEIAHLRGQKSNRAQIILLLHQKHRVIEISKKLGIQRENISFVKTCFLKKRMLIFTDPIGSGRSRKHKKKEELVLGSF